MAEEMTVEEESLYSHYFTACRQKFTSLNPHHTLQKIAETSFYSTMEKAIGAESPCLLYDNSPTVTKIIFSIIKILPRTILDLVRLKLMQLPEFKDSVN